MLRVEGSGGGTISHFHGGIEEKHNKSQSE
jgi:hypothetical protein